jgi:hypothetical protein
MGNSPRVLPSGKDGAVHLVAPPFVWLATCGQKPVDRQIADQRPQVVAGRAAAGTAFPVRGRIGACGCRRFKARRRFFAFGTIAPCYELSALYQAARQECDEFVWRGPSRPCLQAEANWVKPWRVIR